MREPFAQEEAAISLQEIVNLLKEGLKALQQNAGYFKRIKNKVNVEDFEVTLRLGTADAAHTALLCGSLISLLYMVVAYLQNRYSLKGKRVDVVPVFDREDFELHLSCIIAVKLRDIIIAGMQKTAEKLKGGEKIVRASN
nr:DUF2953 domain-containing protein [Caldicoprobacter guelmensis]